jgi:sodium-dependent phosphate cotransporter
MSDSDFSWGRFTIRTLVLCALLYCFFLGLDLMGMAFKLFGKGFAEALITQTSNPLVGLLIGILATTLMQSSSSTTSIVVGLVAAGALNVTGAIPIIMGANIGTSVTATLVSLGHMSRPEEFRRAFAGATVHDFFNWMAVLVLLPLEIATGFLEKTSTKLEVLFAGVGGTKLLNPVKMIVRPVADWIVELLGHSGAITLIVGLVLLFTALKFLVDFLRAVFSGRAERILHRTLFRSAFAAILAGTALTVMVQSSSITTSTVVPLVGAGVITLEQLFPFTIGANIGTTITAILAALHAGAPAGIVVAFSHSLFNLSASLLIYGIPWVRRIPLALARRMGDLAVRSRLLAGAFVAFMFYLLPLLVLVISGAFGDAIGDSPEDSSDSVVVEDEVSVVIEAEVEAGASG